MSRRRQSIRWISQSILAVLCLLCLLGVSCSQFVADRVDRELANLEIFVRSVTLVAQPLRPPRLEIRVAFRSPGTRHVRVTGMEYEAWLGQVEVAHGRIPERQLPALGEGPGEVEMSMSLPLTPSLMVRLAAQGPRTDEGALCLKGRLWYDSPFGPGETTFETNRIHIRPEEIDLRTEPPGGGG